MKIDISRELEFRTARSGGKGGQNVNKVESMVEALFHVPESSILSDEQKIILTEKLAGRINSEGYLAARSSATRSQLDNKALAIEKLNDLVNNALVKKKARISTKPSKASKAKRIEGKKTRSRVKEGRKKVNRETW